MHLSLLLVIFGLIGVAYYFWKRIDRLQKEEALEKKEDAEAMEDLTEKIKDVDINKTKRNREKINRIRNI